MEDFNLNQVIAVLKSKMSENKRVYEVTPEDMNSFVESLVMNAKIQSELTNRVIKAIEQLEYYTLGELDKDYVYKALKILKGEKI